jgi:hypothetical protein
MDLEKVKDIIAWMYLPLSYPANYNDWFTDCKPKFEGEKRFPCLVTCLGVAYSIEYLFTEPTVFKAYYNFEKGSFLNEYASPLLGVTAWMPLPNFKERGVVNET